MNNYLFKDIVIGDEGLLKGPFGSDLKRELYVPKSCNTYKVYIQENIFKEDNSVGDYYISKEYYDSKMSRYAVKENDFIVTCDGTLGEIFQLVNIQEEGVISSSLLRIRLNPELVDYNYFYYLFKVLIKKQLITQGNNSVLKHLPGINEIKYLPIQLPEIDVQKDIGKRLRQLDRKIKINEDICEAINGLSKELYKYWFLQFEFPDENGHPYKSYGGKMIWNEDLQRNIPVGWDVENIGKYISLTRGISYSSTDLEGDGIPMINLNSFNTDTSYKVEGIKSYSGKYSEEKVIKPYDLVICVTQQTSIDLTGRTNVIGKAMLVPDIFNTPLVCSMDVIKLDCKNNLSKYYLRETINYPSIHKYIVGFASGTKIKHLDITGLLEMKHEIPPQKVIQKYNSIISTYEQLKNKIISENMKLAELREYLLPLFFTRKITS